MIFAKKTPTASGNCSRGSHISFRVGQNLAEPDRKITSLILGGDHVA
jgi:hypothetical protein